MCEVPECEVFDNIRGADLGKSSKDYLSIGILKIAVGTFLVEAKHGPGRWVPTPMLGLITEIVNAIMITRNLPQALKDGISPLCRKTR